MNVIRKQIFPIAGRKKSNIGRPLVERRAVKAAPRVSQTYFKDAVPKKNYRFEIIEEWDYSDKMKTNSFIPAKSSNPHLVLRDKLGTPRFTLNYHYLSDSVEPNACKIISIQRERTRYKNGHWSPELEKDAANKFKAQLNGLHPAEFLLCEFIYRNRERIKAGMQMHLHITRSNLTRGLYRPLIDRFFKRKKIRSVNIGMLHIWDTYELNPERKRVKQILGI